MTTARKRSALSLKAEVAFRARVEELGGEVLYEAWLGSDKKHRVRCIEGHEGTPRPTDVQKGRGICRTCGGNDPKAAEAAFRARLADVGATLIEPKWRGAIARHEARCSAGHTCYPIPHMLRRNRVCTKCPQPVSVTASEKFRKRVEELGGEVLDTEWRGNRQKYAVRCSVGHLGQIWPIGLHQGRGMCSTCTGQNPQAAWEKFRSVVERMGGTVVETTWKGGAQPHSCLCPEGHKCRPRPEQLRKGIGMCLTCAGMDPRVAEMAFRARVKELGGEVLEPKWLGSGTPHRARCSAGHECKPTPGYVHQGGGICRRCAGKEWDVFYVVVDEINHIVKFGITSGDPRIRLGVHARNGFDSVVRLIEGLPGDLAPRLERAVRAALRDAREAPVRGREYFPAHVLGLVLDVVDGWTALPAAIGNPRQFAFEDAA